MSGYKMNTGKTRVVIASLGCKLNQAEIEEIGFDFLDAGCLLVPATGQADIYVLNTCTVTHVADRKSRQWLRRARRSNPNAIVVATGCYAQRRPGELAAIDTGLVILDNSGKRGLVSRLRQLGHLESVVGAKANKPEISSRTRSMVSVQEGCQNRCSYCIVPFVRPGPSNREAESVLADIRQRTTIGFREIVLTGTEIGSYENKGIGLAGLVKRILSETEVERLRLSSLQPHQISNDLLNLWQDLRLCPHFHVPLQSASDDVLERMKRKYRVDDYLRALMKIRQKVKDVAITTDVVVGFPGETDREFEETDRFCRQAGFARIHVFPYSRRPQTEAASMNGQVPERTKKQREATLIETARQSCLEFMKGFSGRVMPVLWETHGSGIWSGYTPNYIRVYAPGSNDLANHITPVRLDKIYRDGFLGTING
jgi:threonylcarbamoyladenosine tRNA methylthiotransferase MtaB